MNPSATHWRLVSDAPWLHWRVESGQYIVRDRGYVWRWTGHRYELVEIERWRRVQDRLLFVCARLPHGWFALVMGSTFVLMLSISPLIAVSALVWAWERIR